WLIHKNELWMMNEAGGHVKAALHAPRQVFDEFTGAVSQRRPAETPGHCLIKRCAIEPVVAAEGLKILATGEAGIECKFLRNPAERAAGGLGICRGSEDRDGACLGNDASNNAANQGAFAGSIGPEQPKAFSLA